MLHLDADTREAIDDAFGFVTLFLRRMREHDGHKERQAAFEQLNVLRDQILQGELTKAPADMFDVKLLGSTMASWPLLRLYQALQRLCSWTQNPTGSELNRVIAQFDLESEL